ncbi:diguanylate cyclase [Hydrogenimonas sp.]
MQQLQKLPIKVVYVEDDETILEETAGFLQNYVEKLYIAKNGKEGLDLFIDKGPDAVITDFDMPVMSGLEMIKQIKERRPETPIFVTTAFEDDTLHLTRAIEYGITQYISKKSKPDRLLESIYDYFKNDEQFRFSLSISKEGKILSIGEKFAYFLGYDPKELFGEPVERLIEPIPHIHNRHFIKRLAEERDVEYAHCIFRKKDGSDILLSGSAKFSVSGAQKRYTTKWHPIDSIVRSNEEIKERLIKEGYLKSLMKFHAEVSQDIITAFTVEEFLHGFVEKLPMISIRTLGFLMLMEGSTLKDLFHPSYPGLSFESLIPESIDLTNPGNEKLYLPCFLAAKHNQMVFVDDISYLPDTQLKTILRAHDIVTAISIPMKIRLQNRPAGILTLLFQENHTFDKEELELWQNVANTVAFGIESIKAKIERDELIIKLDMMAHTDKLTGTINRHRGVELLEHEIKRARRYRHPFSLIYFDIDHFKKINDTYGHATGDAVLIKATETIGKNLRATDSLIRWGGEEFMIILPETSLGDAVHIAQKLREHIEKRSADIPVPITASFGVASWEEDQTLDTLIHRADTKMYEAKKLGRNRIAY